MVGTSDESSKLFAAVLSLAVVCGSGAAVATSVLNGIEPGVSTRAQAEKVFGAPTRVVSDVRTAHAPTGGVGALEIEYSAAQVVERIDLSFDPPLARDGVTRGLNLPAAADGSRVQEGRLIEYYGGSRTLVLKHDGSDASSGISLVSYCSQTLFDTLSAGVLKPTENQPVSAAVELSNPNDKPVIVQHNPGSCQDVYVWAQREHEAARRARDAARRQQILEVMVLAQRGTCVEARKLADQYRQRYR